MTLGFVLVRVNSWILFVVRRQNLSTKLHELTRRVTFCAKALSDGSSERAQLLVTGSRIETFGVKALEMGTCKSNQENIK